MLQPLSCIACEAGPGAWLWEAACCPGPVTERLQGALPRVLGVTESLRL